MKTEMLMKKIDGALRPADDVSWETFNRLPHDVVVVARKSRNPDHLKKYWAICAAAADADAEWIDRRDADEWVRLSIRWMRDEYLLDDGRIRVKLKSIALDEMEQTEFNIFYDHAIELLSMRIGMDAEALRVEGEQRAK